MSPGEHGLVVGRMRVEYREGLGAQWSMIYGKQGAWNDLISCSVGRRHDDCDRRDRM